jgi:transcriptional regulator with XRE-family HTH domain
MKERLQVLMSHLGYTAARLAEEIGVQRSGISHILSGRNQPSYDFIIKIIHTFPDISVEWLMTGKGELLKPVPDDTVTEGKSVTGKSAAAIRPALFSEPGEGREFHQESGKSTPKVTNVTYIQRIVIFYTDGTFSNYVEAGKE